ncbi:MAG: hypothetical protein ACR2GN_07860, partial [Bacteroidia bacterium]
MEYIKYILILIFISVISFAEAQCPPGTAPTGTNLVLNGDFSQGDIGFGSGYSTGTGGAFGLVTNSGQYAIVTNPGLAHTNFASFGDHTSGTGNMMVINGSGAANVSIWCQTISVKPFTTYNFSTWIATAVSSSPAILQFSINGVNTGFPFAASSNTGQWQQFFTNWYSGSNLTANICIVNQNTSTFGNDFAIDDIFFEECDCIVQPAAGPDTTVCEGATVQLYATGGNNYQWLPVTGLNNSTIANPVATVSSNSLYYVIISSTYCIDTVSVSINVNPYPVVDAGADDSICAGTNLQLNGNGNGNISWSPTTGLSDPTILNPVASPAQTTMYLLTVEANGCESVDTVTIAVKPAPYVSAGTDKIICGGESVQLNGSGSGIISWSPSTGLSDPSILNPVASPTQTTNYILTVDSGGCENMDTITVIVTPLPAVNAGNDQVMCKGDSVQLNASGTGNITWFPASGLSDPTIFNPVASPGQTITYTLTVEEGGCESVDSVTVTVKPLPQIDAGADLSVCEGDSIQLSATGSGTISWFPSISLDNPSVINPVAFPLQTTVYTLTVDSGGCTNVDSMTLTVIPLPPVNAGMDDTICSGKSVQLNGQGTGSISWSPATVLNNSSILNPVATL